MTNEILIMKYLSTMFYWALKEARFRFIRVLLEVITSFPLGLRRSKCQNKSQNHGISINFNQTFPLRMTGTYVHLRPLRPGHLLLFKEWFHIILEAFHVSTLQRTYLIVILVRLTDPLSTPAAAEIVAVAVHVRLLPDNLLSSLLVSARRSHSLLLWQ